MKLPYPIQKIQDESDPATKLYGLAVFTAILMVIGMGFSFWGYWVGRSDVRVIEDAGKQRVLIHRMASSVKGIYHEDDSSSLPQLQNDKEHFETVLTDLIEADSEPNYPPAPTERIQNRLEEVKVEWNPFRKRLKSFIAHYQSNGRVSPEYTPQEVEQYVHAHTPHLARKMDRVVKAWSQYSSARIRWMMWGEILLIIAGLILLGGATYWLGTRVKEAEKERTNFKRAVHESGHGVVITDTEGIINYVNPAFERMTGYSRSELMGETPNLLNSGEHDDSFFRELWETITSGDVWRGEMINRRQSGELFYVRQTISPVQNSQGAIESYIAVQEDITEQKEMEKSLRKRENLYRTLFEEATEGFLIESFDDEVLAANKSAAELLGYSTDELEGMKVGDLTLEEIKEESGETGIVQHHLDQYGSSVCNWYYVHRDSSKIPVEKSVTPIDYFGTDAVLVCIRDRSQIERIRKKDQRKTSIVSQITHDLRTPLNSITGMGNLLRKTELSKEQHDYVDTILNAARNMERLTNDVLDLNRIERGELTLNNEPFNIQQLLGEVISLYRLEAESQDLILSTKVSEEVPTQLIGDPDRLKQVLHNLVDNAIKYTRDGSVTIEVEQRAQKDSIVRLSFSVADTGKGIPESEIDEIFDQHVQHESETVGSIQGLGLGLSICQTLVDMMNGDIEVESEVGEGTTFTFTIELEEAKQEEDSSSVDLQNRNVLIVDDNVFVRNVFQTYLDQKDINTFELETGEAALEELTDQSGTTYDVVFLDKRLPDTSGVEVLKQVVDTKGAIDPTRIYVISGDPPSKVKQLIDPISCAGVLEKPIDESDLIDAVSSVLRLHNEGKNQQENDPILHEITSRKPEPFHILVADDDQDTRTMLDEMLSPVADDLTFVENGEEAVNKRLENPPNLIFMDVQMPVMDGIEATKIIRKNEQEQNVPPVSVIAHSARAMKQIEDQCLDSGADAFIRKPIKQKSLYRAILDVLTRSRKMKSGTAGSTTA